MANRSSNKGLLIGILVIVVAILGYMILTMPDRRTTSERIGDAISELPNDPQQAVRELEPRTPGERLGDAVEDTGENIRRNTDR